MNESLSYCSCGLFIPAQAYQRAHCFRRHRYTHTAHTRELVELQPEFERIPKPVYRSISCKGIEIRIPFQGDIAKGYTTKQCETASRCELQEFSSDSDAELLDSSVADYYRRVIVKKYRSYPCVYTYYSQNAACHRVNYQNAELKITAVSKPTTRRFRSVVVIKEHNK